MDYMISGDYIERIGKAAKLASKSICSATSSQKNDALNEIAYALRKCRDAILEANSTDLYHARVVKMRESLIDRLTLNETRIESIANACENLTKLSDPVGMIDEGCVRPNGMRITKTRVPMGVIGIIYESRPNVTVDAASLCLKSGNAVILRGGKEASETNKCLVKIMRAALSRVGFDEDIIQYVEDTARDAVMHLMKANEYVDVLIPRGGAGLINAVIQNATVPVIQTGVGNCHVYVDETADLRMAVDIVDNGKTSRPSVCNAVETCLVHKSVAEEFLPKLKSRLDKSNVEIRGCEITRMILGDDVIPATDEDFETEFLDYILAVRVVDDLAMAIEHIQKYSTGHSECIVTQSLFAAETFKKEIDAAAVYVNCSTRFTDGEEFGLGAEIGISTQKLHARGPMGLKELTTIKYIVEGDGQIRE